MQYVFLNKFLRNFTPGYIITLPFSLSREKPQTFSSAKKSKEIVSIDSVSSLFYDEGGSCHFDLLSLSLSVRKSCSFFITTHCLIRIVQQMILV